MWNVFIVIVLEKHNSSINVLGVDLNHVNPERVYFTFQRGREGLRKVIRRWAKDGNSAGKWTVAYLSTHTVYQYKIVFPLFWEDMAILEKGYRKT